MKDLELLEIAGYVAYDELKVKDIVMVNGTKFEVLNTAYDIYSSGMQAATLQNVETGEYVIAYQGTDPSDWKDIVTDVSLAGSSIPQQLKDAQDYYKTMNEKYGIQYVCGNSLGGALANHVAVNNKDIQSVTYNPAIIPGNIEGEANNIRNYLGNHDPLTIAQLGAGYYEKIPGQHIMIENNIPALQFLVANHVGYVEDGEIRLEGRSTPIKVDLITGLPFSVFTNDFLNYDYQGSGQKITIDENALRALCNGIEKIQNNITYAQAYLDEAKGIVDSEGNQFYSRLEELQNMCGEMFSSNGFDFFSNLEVYNHLKDMISSYKKDIQKYYSIARGMSLIFIPLVIVIPYLKAMVDLLENANLVLDRLEGGYFIIKNNGIPMLFRDIDTLFEDGLPMKISKHLDIMQSNRDKITNRLEIYKTQVSKVWSLMEQADRLDIRAIDIPVHAIPIMDNTPLEVNEYFENIVSEKSAQLEGNFQNFKSYVHSELDEEFLKLHDNVSELCNNIRFITPIVPVVENVTSWLDIPIMKKDDEIIDNIHNLCKIWNKIKRDCLPALEGIVSIVQNAEGRIDEVLEAMKPYIKNAIFNNHGYNDVMIYNLSAYNIYKSTSVVFEDINYQLSENESKVICKLSENAGILKRDLLVIMKQIQQGTLQ